VSRRRPSENGQPPIPEVGAGEVLRVLAVDGLDLLPVADLVELGSP